MEAISGILLGMDPRTIWIAAGIVGVLGLLALIKKAIKVGILIVVIALAITYGGSVIQGIQDKYQLEIDGTNISMVIDNKDYELDITKIKEVQVLNTANKNIEIQVKSGDDSDMKISIPEKVFNILKPILEKQDINIVQ